MLLGHHVVIELPSMKSHRHPGKLPSQVPHLMSSSQHNKESGLQNSTSIYQLSTSLCSPSMRPKAGFLASTLNEAVVIDMAKNASSAILY